MDSSTSNEPRTCAFCNKGIELEQNCVTINGIHYHSRCFDRRQRQPKPTA